jgi:hypothetical protein
MDLEINYSDHYKLLLSTIIRFKLNYVVLDINLSAFYKTQMKYLINKCLQLEIEEAIKLLPEIFHLIENPTEEQKNLYNLLSI